LPSAIPSSESIEAIDAVDTRQHSLPTESPAVEAPPPARLITDVAYAFVGSVIPEDARVRSAAFSAAGQMFQRELLLGLRQAGLPVSLVISSEPVPSRRHTKHESSLWVRGGSGRLSDGTPVRLISFVNVTPLKQLMIGAATFFELLRWGWRNRRVPHRVVHAYNLSVPPGIFVLAAARLIGAKAIVSVCDIEVPGETVPDGLYWRADRKIQGWLIPRFDGHTVASQAIADDFLQGRDFMRLEGGVPAEVFARGQGSAGAFSRDVANEQAFTIVAAGQLTKTNGIPVLLQAFSQLDGNDFRLRIAGSGPLEADVRQSAAADSRIEFLGRLPFEKVLDLYDSADLLVNLRITQSRNTRYFFPSKMMEYLASGVPVLSTCTGHVEEEFGTFTYLLKEETPEGLAAMLRKIANTAVRDRHERAANAREYMRQQKTWAAQTRKLLSYIRSSVLWRARP
jgi:glycosyltransferase involved in cell wall biosynthesis